MIEHMPKRIFFVFEMIALIISTLLIIAILYIFLPYTYVWYGLLWLVGAVTVLVIFGYIPFYFVNFSVYINDNYVMLRSGVFFEKKQYLYRNTICYVSVYHNPFSRILSISSLVVGAAGGMILIPLLDSKKANAIRKLLCDTDFDENL